VESHDWVRPAPVLGNSASATFAYERLQLPLRKPPFT
jgi:hypothetical protein